MKTIPLTKGYFTKVDDEDYEEFASVRWYTAIIKGKNRVYPRARRAIRNVHGGKRQKFIWLSREIVNAPKGKWVDHINGDTLDNRKSNLRICTPSGNAANREKPITNTSGYKGVRKANSRKNGWRAQIKVDGKFKHLGNFSSKKDAARAYNKAAKKYRGEFARPNILEANS